MDDTPAPRVDDIPAGRATGPWPPRAGDPQRSIADAAVSLNRALDPAGLLADVAVRVRVAVGARACVVGLAAGARGPEMTSVSAAAGWTDDADAAATAAGPVPAPEVAHDRLVVALAGRDGEHLGRVRAWADAGRPFGPGDLAVASQIAQVASVAVERLRRELDLEASRGDLAEAQRIAHMGSWIQDLDDGRVTCSDEVWRIYGLGAGEAFDDIDGLLARVHPDDRGVVAVAMEAVAERGGAHRWEHRIVRPGGEVRTVLVRAEASLPGDGRPRVRGTVLDITRRRDAEDALHLQAARITDLAADRRRLVAEVLDAEEGERQRIAEVLHESVLQDLLAARQDLGESLEEADGLTVRGRARMARAEAGLTVVVAALREAVGELHPLTLTHDGLRSALESTCARIARRAGVPIGCAVADSAAGPHDRLVLSLTREFLVNAEKHAGAARVSVAVSARAGVVTLVVEDDGVGFAPGTGEGGFRVGHLGLASARERVEVLGGTLAITTTPGSGTRIVARLPVAPAAAAEDAGTTTMWSSG